MNLSERDIIVLLRALDTYADREHVFAERERREALAEIAALQDRLRDYRGDIVEQARRRGTGANR